MVLDAPFDNFGVRSSWEEVSDPPDSEPGT
jgi:hypothetical protein